ncbi:M20/M25/M40 family metallo-hydrolase [Botrimarina hoheduenensis]|uniref:Carboxypeptidase G2 n=1 Tax=Botrimarina hoheduenensis TaxID=2528000 RepID=A0A5C5W9L8_9BACT|nr:M20/M25/M40 family metallo-hydrolase [Botrimarina hoheduenensis]TWT47360.1 Carboxypeptidase G2 precursor [Botrimarina hoheduenensis]
MSLSPTPLEPPVADREALDLVCQLMAIPGRGGEERAVMDFIEQRLAEAGLPLGSVQFDSAHKKSALGGGVGNAILKLPGRGPRRLLMAHTDTVPICIGSKPRVRGGRVRSADPTTGLGADDRSGTAVLLTTALGLLRSGTPHPPLTFLWTVQEEGGINGARHVALGKLGKPALAFNFDGGTPTRLTLGATGGYRMWVEITGSPSHAGQAPERGVSAIAIAALAVADLVENGWHGLIEKGGKRGTANVGVLEAGVATNVVAERARLHIEARGHDPKFRARIVREIEAAFRRAVKRVVSSEGRRGVVRFEGRLDYEAFRLVPDDPSVLAAQAVLREWGHDAELAIANGGLDANWLTAHRVPTVSIGCGQKQIHTVDEELDVAEFQLARRIAWSLAIGGGVA